MATSTDANRIFILPWPPCVNQKNRRFPPRKYREAVVAEVWTRAYGSPMVGRIKCLVTVVPPDRRRRDLDNLLKEPLDALRHAGAFGDDSQIDELHILRAPPQKPGHVAFVLSILGERA